MLEHLIDDALDGDELRRRVGERAARSRPRRGRSSSPRRTIRTSGTMPKITPIGSRRSSSCGGRPPASLRELERALEQAASAGPREPAQRRCRGRRARRSRRPTIGPAPASQVDRDRARDPGRPARLPRAARRSRGRRAALDGDSHGDASRSVAAVRHRGLPCVRGRPSTSASAAHANNRVYADEFLAQIPASIHSFAVGRLASPVFDIVDEARASSWITHES